MCNWRERSLGELATWHSGGTPKTSVEEYWNGDTPWISAASLQTFFIDSSDRNVTALGIQNGTRLVPEGTIIFVVRGMSLMKEFRLGITRRQVAFGQDCKALVPIEGIDTYFLAYAIRARTRKILSLVDAAGHGTGRLQTDRISTLRIPLPGTIHEQKNAVAPLRALDEKIAVNDRVANTLKELGRTHYSRAYSESDKWDSIPLGEIARLSMGQSPAGDTCNKEGIGQPLLNGPTEFGQHSPTPNQWTTAPTRVCNAGDLLLCVRGSTTGRMNRADQEYAIGRGLAAISARRSPRYTNLIHFSLLERMAELLALASGSVFPNLSRESIEKFPLKWPSGNSGQRLVDLLSSFMDQVAHCALENKTLAELRDTLLPKLMSGEIRVREAEKVVEEVT